MAKEHGNQHGGMLNDCVYASISSVVMHPDNRTGCVKHTAETRYSPSRVNLCI